MLVPIVITNPFITLRSTTTTVIEPGGIVEVVVQIESKSQLQLVNFEWKLIDPLASDQNSNMFPVSLKTNETKVLKFSFRSTGNEGFGEIQATLRYLLSNVSGEIKSVQWNHWISVFKRFNVGFASSLENFLRDRLIMVVNSSLIMAFLYMAHFLKFFDHYLNIEIPERLAQIISQQLHLDKEPLPVDEETFLRIASGDVSYYGIEKFELIAEEECVESDDRYDAEDLKEVRHPDIDLQL